MSDVREKIIATIRNLPDPVGYNEILEAIIIQKQIEEARTQFEREEFYSHDEVMKELDDLINGL